VKRIYPRTSRIHHSVSKGGGARSEHARLRTFQILFLLGFLCLLGRLFYWQIIQGKVLSAQARGQYEYKSEIDASRGSIFSRDGSWIVTSGRAWTIAASLPEMKDDDGPLDKKKVSDQLAPFFVQAPLKSLETEDEEAEESDSMDVLLEKEEDRLYSLLTREKIVWTPLKSRVSEETKKKIEELDINGLHFEPEEIRIYPEASSAAQLLGFVGKDKTGQSQGYFGLEGYYDTAISGKPGFVSRESDPLGAPILLGETREVSAIRGVDLYTHIDSSVQITLDKRLKEGIARYGAKAGSAVIMDPKTGAIYGMSSYPSYDPGKYWEFGDVLFANPVVSGAFEPGSIFKVLVMAAGLDAGVVTPNTTCDICSGPYKIDKYLIETWNREYTANSTMTNVIVHSDNVGMVFVANHLGEDRLYDYIKKFGIGESSGVDLQGEAVAPLRDKKDWGPVEQATASFGQGVATTPIQMIRAIGAIANDGVMLRPKVVDKLVGDSWSKKIEPDEGTRVISEKAAEEMTQMMVEAAKNGESKWTYLKGFRVAGKTGTAQIAIDGYYDEEKTIASFVGFAPYDDPKFIMLITLQEPQTSQWASETAAPLWYTISRDLFLHFGMQPEEQKE
jgi:cell division protein FtsI/penicillin-binding protein 2